MTLHPYSNDRLQTATAQTEQHMVQLTSLTLAAARLAVGAIGLIGWI